MKTGRQKQFKRVKCPNHVEKHVNINAQKKLVMNRELIFQEFWQLGDHTRQ